MDQTKFTPEPQDECEDCYGRGYTVGPICCGKLTSGGECRGDCAIPEQLTCISCGGTGYAHDEEAK